MTEFEYFLEIQTGLPRQGPGDDESTLLALNNIIHNLPENISILDVGCGPGMQTITLAKNSNSNILALDFYQPFLDQLKERVIKENLENKISLMNKSMFEMDFPDESFDIIWLEGAIYIYGFEKALGDWKKFIKPSCYIVCSHIGWLKENPPSEIMDYWRMMNEDIQSINTNLSTVVNCGYDINNYFILPEESWWTDYYTPLLERLPHFNTKYSGNETAMKVINEIVTEIEIFKKYSEYYGYVFYVLRKND